MKRKFLRPFEMSDELFSLLREALIQLSPKQQKVLHLRYWENMTIQEIACLIGHSWDSTDAILENAVHHARLRIIQLSHAQEEAELLRSFQSIAA